LNGRDVMLKNVREVSCVCDVRLKIVAF